MKLGRSNWLIAIVFACGLLATGCAPLSRNHEEKLPAESPPSSTDNYWGRAKPATTTKKHGLSYFVDRIFCNDSSFFNDKSHEIEENLGY